MITVTYSTVHRATCNILRLADDMKALYILQCITADEPRQLISNKAKSERERAQHHSAIG